jgi:hypothetical protein
MNMMGSTSLRGAELGVQLGQGENQWMHKTVRPRSKNGS